MLEVSVEHPSRVELSIVYIGLELRRASGLQTYVWETVTWEQWWAGASL